MISGTVWYDANEDEAIGVGEVPTPNVTVTADWPDGSRHTAETDEDGVFSFATTLAGEYRLYIRTSDTPPNLTVNPTDLLIFFDGSTAYESADFALQPAVLSRVDRVVALLQKRHKPIVEAYCLDDETLQEIAADILDQANLDADGSELTPAQVSDVRVVAEVVAWRWVEDNAALAFDFSADGLSATRSKLFDQAEKMRLRAEDKAYRLGVGKFKLPAVHIELPPRWRTPVYD